MDGSAEGEFEEDGVVSLRGGQRSRVPIVFPRQLTE